MFCPQCQAEYRQGFTRCSDCDVDLVHELAQEVPRDGETLQIISDDETEGALRVIWKFDSQAECVSVCRELIGAGIRYRVAQIPESRDLKMAIKWRYEIAVLSADYERALEVLDIGEPRDDRAQSTEEETETGELPPQDDSIPDEEVRSDSFLRKWYPEDATVEVWSQPGADDSTTVDLSLSENLIRFRSDLQEGTRKVFVFPEDESRAREIIRQIVDGAPPE
jgi:hypothetical protein